MEGKEELRVANQIMSTISVDQRQRLSQEEKEKGNKAFNEGNLKDAVYFYTKAIEYDPQNHVYYGNRAQALIKLKMLVDAENDCTKALSLNPDFVKGYFRRGMVRKAANRYNDAVNDFKQVLNRDPRNKMAQQELNEVQAMFGKMRVDEKRPQTVAKVAPKREESKESTVPIKLPSQVPLTSYQFEMDWRELVGEKSDELRCQYLQMIEPQVFAHLFSHSIEPSMFSDILRALFHCKEREFPFKILSALTEIPRFEFMVLFMDKKEKEIIGYLLAEASQVKHDEHEIKRLEALYHIR